MRPFAKRLTPSVPEKVHSDSGDSTPKLSKAERQRGVNRLLAQKKDVYLQQKASLCSLRDCQVVPESC